MLTADTFHPADLGAADVDAWRALCACEAYDSPLLGPDFAQAVGRVRDDARVTVWRDGAQAVGFLAHHRRPGGLARPIGAPLADYHALISVAPLDVSSALGTAGLAAYRFSGLLDPAGAFDGFAGSPRDGFLIELVGSADDYWEALRAASPKRFKNYRRLDHKLEREGGEIVIVAPDPDPTAFETLIAWKRAQLARTGGQDFLGAPWTQRLLRELFERRDGEFRGLTINLYVGGKLVAGHFGVRCGPIFHPWIAATDPDAASWSPGQVFLSRAISAMPGLGLTRYDLGPGHEHYKRPYASTTRTVTVGLVWADNPAGRRAQLAEQAWTLAGARGEGAVARLRRRLDAIATVELSLSGRARSLAGALASRALKPVSSSEAA